MLTNDTPIAALAGIGPNYAAKLEKLDIFTVGDLIEYYPFRYENYAQVKAIAHTQSNETVTIIGTIWQIKNIRTRFGKFLTRAIVNDGTGTIEMIWFNQSYLTKTLKEGLQVSFSGKVTIKNSKPQLIAPSYELVLEDQELINTGRLVPVYPVTEGITSRWLRAKIAVIIDQVLDDYTDWLPRQWLAQHTLIDLQTATKEIHFPKTQAEIDHARRRIA